MGWEWRKGMVKEEGRTGVDKVWELGTVRGRGKIILEEGEREDRQAGGGGRGSLRGRGRGGWEY